MKKTQHLIVRITEAQLKQLADALITEQKNKSTIVRAALDKYMDGTKRGDNTQDLTSNEDKKVL